MKRNYLVDVRLTVHENIIVRAKSEAAARRKAIKDLGLQDLRADGTCMVSVDSDLEMWILRLRAEVIDQEEAIDVR